jgi:hypothetical protein
MLKEFGGVLTGLPAFEGRCASLLGDRASEAGE